MECDYCGDKFYPRQLVTHIKVHFYTKNGRFCTENDGFCTENDGLMEVFLRAGRAEERRAGGPAQEEEAEIIGKETNTKPRKATERGADER